MLSRADLIEASQAVYFPPFTGNAVLAAKLLAEAEKPASLRASIMQATANHLMDEFHFSRKAAEEAGAAIAEVVGWLNAFPERVSQTAEFEHDRPPVGPDGESPDSWARCTP